MKRPHPDPVLQAMALAAFTAGYVWYKSTEAVSPAILLGWRILLLLIFLALLSNLISLVPRILAHIRARRTKGLRGTARWATKKQVLKASTSARNGFLAGMAGKHPVWLPIESSGLVLSPAGGGKTVGFVIPALMSNPASMIVADLKGTLAAITRRRRQKKFGHKIFILNPAGRFGHILGPGARFNPLSILEKSWADPMRRKFLISDARKLARNLLPEPVKEGENTFFRNGSRKLLVFAMIYLAMTVGKVTLSAALELISDMNRISDALYTAAADDRLSGDLARMANDILGKLHDGRPEQLESFREGALQVLEPYAPSGVLADATNVSDFDPSILREEGVTVYIVCDPTQMEAFAGWLGLLMEAFTTDLIRNAEGRDVVLMIDEATNFKFPSLPGLLTAAREFKLRIWLVIQELEQFSHVYGREALDTVLSQTEVKIVHGSRSHKTCQLISDMLGEYSVAATSYNTGSGVYDPVTRSVSETGRKMLTSAEVAQFGKVIVFKDKMPPMALGHIGYHEISPYRDEADPNPLFGNKRYKGKVRLRL